jgi:hypothetical protein
MNSGVNGNQNCLRDNSNIVKDKSHMGKPYLRESDEQDSVLIQKINANAQIYANAQLSRLANFKVLGV